MLTVLKKKLYQIFLWIMCQNFRNTRNQIWTTNLFVIIDYDDVEKYYYNLLYSLLYILIIIYKKIKIIC